MLKTTTRLLAVSALLSLLAFAGGQTEKLRTQAGGGLQPAALEQRVSPERRLLAQTIRTHLVRDGGCTIDPRTGKTVGQVDAYAVSLAGYEAKFDTLPSLDEIAAYVRRHAPVMNRSRRVHLGGWIDERTGYCYLDLSELIPDRAAALARGRANGQRCIYHLGTGQAIDLPREDRLSSRIPSAAPTRR